MKDEAEYIDDHLEKLGKRLKQLRKAKGYSNYEQFCFEHNFARSSYSRFERGEDLRVSSLLRVLRALEVTVDEFFSEGFNSEIETKKE